MIRTFSRETPRAARQMPRSGDNVMRYYLADKRPRLIVRVFDWCRLRWSWLADVIFLGIIVAIAYGAWCLT